MPKVRRILIAEMEVESAETAGEEFSDRLDAFREAVLPSSEYGITLYQATSADLADFASRGLLLRDPGTLIDE